MSIDEIGIDAFRPRSRHHDSLGCLLPAAKEARRDIVRLFLACNCERPDNDTAECIKLAVECEVERRMCDDMPVERIKFSEHVAFLAIDMLAEAPRVLRNGDEEIDIRAIPLAMDHLMCLDTYNRIRTGKWDRSSVDRFIEQTVAGVKLVEFAFDCKDYP